MHALVTVVGTDKIGIVAGVTETLAQLEANILEISQTLMSGAFTMMMVVETKSEDFSAFQAELIKKGEQLGVNIHVQNEAIFNAMHKL
ncbi:ACT domain-containing protein [Lactococcus kimchii]|uniref:ACT domain-containing protein n=1 Tax=Lactococcus sp. S-13 TaxID=2507158 RepID=UPI001022D9EA|nr:ACT domain-containing protein [Lactococcus sp. S-13]RZI48393.1 ACT domain-containing protein [Lactococcus sp. S-13]